MKKIVLLCSMLFINLSFATTYYVNVNATGTNNGLTWTNAFVSLQTAISNSIAGDQIWVATGTYHASTSNRSSSFVLKNGVNLYGGFNGTETSINQRIIANNPTTLSGDIGQLGDNTDNTKIIVKIQNITSSIIFDGFRIVSAYDSASTAEGGGFMMKSNLGGNITINNCILYDNYAYRTGGGALVDETNATFNDTQFLYNSSYDYGGGAIYSANVSSSNVYLNRCKFIGNSSRSGAVIIFDGYNLVFDRCIITNNTTTTSSMISIGGSGNFKLLNSLIVGNLLTSNTQAAIIEYGTNGGTERDIINCTIVHNRNSSTFSIVYPPIKYLNIPLRIYNSIIYDNTTSGTSQISSGCTVQNCILSGSYSTAVNSYFVDPNFVSPSTLASAPFDVTSYDYSLLNISSGINAGNNSWLNGLNFDLAGNNRIYDANVDIGAYEYSAPLSNNTNLLTDSNMFYDYKNDEFIINDDKYLGKTIFLYDLYGRLVKEIDKGSSINKLEISSNGIYIIKIQDIAIKIAVL